MQVWGFKLPIFLYKIIRKKTWEILGKVEKISLYTIIKVKCLTGLAPEMCNRVCQPLIYIG